MFSVSGSQSDNAPNQRPAREAKWSRHVGFGLMVLAAVATSGCNSESRVPVFLVTGKVSYQGKVPVGAHIVLNPVNAKSGVALAPSGDVQDDGSFKISSYDQNDGAPEGDYAVTIQWYKFDEKYGGAGPNVVPKKYSSPATSPIPKVSVKGGPTQIPPIEIAKN